ncbi:MAG: alpha/beta hydrolase [Shewanellaceae bacterium]|nr:alpha/beta hydrolase [Shewanellaceae bacterium]
MFHKEINGSQIHYLDVGQGPVLLFGHAFLWDSLMLAPQLEKLSAEYRCIVPDLWAHGKSGHLPQTTNTLTDMARDMLGLMDALNIDKFGIIGVSISAMWAAELAVLVPKRIKTLILMGAVIGISSEQLHMFYSNMVDMALSEGKVPSELVDVMGDVLLAKKNASSMPKLINYYTENLQKIENEMLADILQMCRMQYERRDILDELSKLTSVPILIVVGNQDLTSLGDPSRIDAMQAALPQSCLERIENAGQVLTLEQPEIVTEIIESFLVKSNFS